jgi:mono/diheme cytochrome c family protein
METQDDNPSISSPPVVPADEPAPAAAPPKDGPLYGVLAEFQSPGALVKAARKVREAGYTQFDCYSPFPVHGIDEAMGIKRTILPLLVFGGGITGLIGGLFLQWYLNAYNWPFSISGKPVWSIPANIPIAFEGTILFSVLTTFFGMWILNRLPQVWHPFFRLDRFAKVSDDGFMLGIEAKDGRFDLAATTRLLKDAGALEVESCYLDPDPAKKTMPRWVYGLIIATTVFALIPFAVIAKARASKSTEPHYHVFSDMDYQDKAKSDAAFDLFPDGRANRGEIPGTIARGQLRAEDDLYRGLASVDPADTRSCLSRQVDKTGAADDLSCEWIEGLPAAIKVDRAFVERGRSRYDIYCAPCHGYDGQGKGAVPQRWAALGNSWEARNLVQAGGVVVKMPNGQLFNTISNGFNTMMGYSAQIPVQDRWAVVLYVRALQRAQNAQLEDDPEFLQSAK